ncbi:MAG: hypothetical protein RL885_17015 [Planctomycetota bacterium]
MQILGISPGFQWLAGTNPAPKVITIEKKVEMESLGPSPDHVPYCERLDMTAPVLEDFREHGCNYRLLMILTLLERGGPMTLEEIAARIREAGIHSDEADLEQSLRSAWHGRDSVRRDADGRFTLNLSSPEMQDDLAVVRTIGRDIPRPPEPEWRAPHEPLHDDELIAAFEGRDARNISKIQEVAAILDLAGGSLPLARLEERLDELQCHRPPITDRDFARWKERLVIREGDRVRLSKDAAEIEKMRVAVRTRALPTLRENLRHEHIAQNLSRARESRTEGRARDEALAEQYRRALVRVLPRDGEPQAAALLDLASHSIRTFVGPTELEEWRSLLGQYDVLVGDEILPLLERLGRDPNAWKTIDIRPPQKTKKLGTNGRTHRLTTEQLLTSTTGWRRPLGDPKQIEKDLRSGNDARLRERLEKDLKALAVYYRYGQLQGYVWWKRGSQEAVIPANWRLNGELGVYHILKRAGDQSQSVQICWGAPLAGPDAFEDAPTCRLLSLSHHWVEFDQNGLHYRLALSAIWDVRVVEE